MTKLVIWINSLASGICGTSFQSVGFEHKIQIHFIRIFCEIILRQMLRNILDDNSTLVSGNRFVSSDNEP